MPAVATKEERHSRDHNLHGPRGRAGRWLAGAETALNSARRSAAHERTVSSSGPAESWGGTGSRRHWGLTTQDVHGNFSLRIAQCSRALLLHGGFGPPDDFADLSRVEAPGETQGQQFAIARGERPAENLAKYGEPFCPRR